MPMVFREELTSHDYLHRSVGESLARGQTRFQSYHFWRSPSFGVCIALDGDLQSTEADCATYHEALVHPAMLLHPAPRRVLICGGGEGATAREVLRHPCVEEVVMCDIDAEFVDLCREIVPSWSGGAFQDPRLEVRYQDIVRYVHEHKGFFDVVIGDLVDLASLNPQVGALYDSPFLKALAGRMAPGALMATQASALYAADHKRHLQIRASLGESFTALSSYRVTIPSFFAPWGFVVTGEAPRRASECLALFKERLEARGLVLEAFDAPSLAATFMLTPDVRRLLEACPSPREAAR